MLPTLTGEHRYTGEGGTHADNSLTELVLIRVSAQFYWGIPMENLQR